ncbi:16584_t:CDS:2 [Acaulospora colombiana]|uniref:16584_t:CDS:1 n=1 Tax=Acaulospora colombiana TaxID=27376 RepID=A0ACA9QKL0_9GLOM|nr:16584_t:CDS:2 [Acaulospora colombiana]
MVMETKDLRQAGATKTNREEARYRNDAEPNDDKLGDCAKLRCGQVARKPKRKRASSVDDDSNEDVPISALEPRERHARRKSEAGAHGRNQSRTRLEDILSDEDVVMSDATVEKAKPGPKPKKKAPTAAEKAAVKVAEPSKEKEDTPAKEEGPAKGKGKGKGAAAAGAATTTATGGRGKGKKDADAKPEKETTSATKPKETAKAAKKRKTED